jgi:hypothetical protein
MDKNYLTRFLPFIVFLTGAVGFLFTDRPFSYEKHDLSESDSNISAAEIPARLWQDPFQAIDDYFQQDSGKSSKENSVDRIIELVQSPFRHHEDSTELLRAEIHGICSRKNDRLRIMPIIITRTQYAEIKEFCTRSRYATIAALEFLGYEPNDNEHIGSFDYFQSSGSVSRQAIHIPFEWYQRRGTRLGSWQSAANGNDPKDYVLVTWIPESLFHRELPGAEEIEAKHRSSYDLLHGLILQMICADWRARSANHDLGPAAQIAAIFGKGEGHEEIPRFHIIANCSSAIIGQLMEDKNDACSYCTFPIASARSTAIPQLLVDDPNNEDKEGKRIHFANASDGQTLFATLLELNRRGINIVSENDLIGIVSEWDTFYGRSIPKTFCSLCNIIRDAVGADSNYLVRSIYSPIPYAKIDEKMRYEIRNQDNPQYDWPINVKKYTYMEGMDGEYPGALTKAEQSGKPSPEKAEGTSQFDYLRRLGQQMKREENPWVKRRFRAIGILGNNTADKLLALQALRPQFPEAVFFTTDLDCRFLEPDQESWSRNTIVASGFGLESRRVPSEPRSEKLHPPFRDCYQTSLFEAIRFSLNDTSREQSMQTIRNDYQTNMFEIGRGKAIELPTSKTGIEAAAHSHHNSPSFWVLTFIVVSVIIIVIAYMLSQRKYYFNYNKLPHESIDKRFWLCCGLLTFPLSASIWLWIAMGSSLDPITIINGVSIWPSIIVKNIVLYLSVLLFFISILKLRANDRTVERAFILSDKAYLLKPTGKTGFQGTEKPLILHSFDPIMNVFTNTFNIFRKSKVSPYDNYGQCIIDSRIDSDRLWTIHKARSRLTYGWLRHALRFIVLFGLIITILNLFGLPRNPHRDPNTEYINVYLGILLLVYMCGLAFFVIDTLNNFSQFIQTLVRGETSWPDQLTRTITTQYEVENSNEDKFRKPAEPDSKASPRRDIPAMATLLDIRIIQKRTEAIESMIYYPIILLFILIIARNHFFADLTWTWCMALMNSIMPVWLIWTAAVLVRSARNARSRAIERMDRLIFQESDPEQAKRLHQIRDEIHDINSGSFTPFLQHPLFGAMILPLGGVGGSGLLNMLLNYMTEYMSKAH